MKYCILDSEGFIVEVLDATEDQANAFGFIRCDSSILPGCYRFDGVFYPPKPSVYHFFDTTKKQWVLDVQKELFDAKQAKRLEIEQAFNSARNGAFPIQINDNPTGSMLIPAGNPGNDAIIDWCKKTSATKAFEPSAYVFIPYTKENETTVLRTTFSSDAELKPVFITTFGVLKYGKDGNKIKAKTIYTRIDYLNKAALTLILSSIEKMKTSDSNYRRELLLALDSATDLNAVKSIAVKTKKLNDNSLMNVGFTPTIFIENGVVIKNTTGLDVEI